MTGRSWWICILALGLVGPLAGCSKPSVGDVYTRAAYDSVRVDSVIGLRSDVSPEAQRLVTDLLTRALRVRIEHVGRCGALGQAGAQDDILAPHPVPLFVSAAERCFSYTVQYDLPLEEPMLWQERLMMSVPLRLTLIHPIEDLRNFCAEPCS